MQTRFGYVLAALAGLTACDAPVHSVHAATKHSAEPVLKTVIDLRDLTQMPDAYAWFDFRPNVKKLILAGAPETQHIAILRYTAQDGSVGLHYHANTESVYVIDGTQTDAKGTYPSGTVYFNPPGSGHQITKSTGYFLLAYASAPDFKNTALIGEYTPVRIDTLGPEPKLTSSLYTVPLDPKGGMKAQITELKASETYTFTGNYLLVVRGSCVVDGITHGPSKLVVTQTVSPQPFQIAHAAYSSKCITLGISF